MLDKAGEEQVLNLNRMEAMHFHLTKKQVLEVCLLCPYKRDLEKEKNKRQV